jgi:hypothetical protein
MSDAQLVLIALRWLADSRSVDLVERMDGVNLFAEADAIRDHAATLATKIVGVVADEAKR